MAASFNKVILIGNLTRDPELRSLPSGNSIARLGLAVNRTYTDKEGTRKEETTFLDVDAFGKQAETIAKYCKKGSALFVEGRLKLDTWEDKTTHERRSKLGIVLETFQFLSSGARRDDVGGNASVSYAGYDSVPEQRQRQVAQRPTETTTSTSNEVDEDIPF